jgi:hypothetical protein
MTTPEARARQTIDALLAAAGWHVCNMADANIRAAQGVAIREFRYAAVNGLSCNIHLAWLAPIWSRNLCKNWDRGHRRPSMLLQKKALRPQAAPHCQR